MSSIQIDRGIPAPSLRPKKGESKYPFMSMEIGDSFLVGLDGRKSWAFIYKAIDLAQRKSNRRFTTRLLEYGSRRVWRIA